MASYAERPRTEMSSAWQVNIRVKGHAPVIQTFDTREAAEQFVAKVEPGLKKKQKTGQAILDALRKKKPGHIDFYGEELRQTLLLFSKSEIFTDRQRKTMPTILKNVDDVKIADARGAWVKTYIAKMRKKTTMRGSFFSYETLVVHLGIMRSACQWRAEELDLDLPTLHFSCKSFPKNWKNERDRRLESGEHDKIMAQMRAINSLSKYHWRLLYRLAIETGARLQELVLAEWPEIKLADQVWTIPAAHTKSEKTRTVALSPTARRIVRLLRLLAAPNSSRIFHPLGSPNTVSAGFHKYMKRAGIDGLRFHDLRHEAISRMVLHKPKANVHLIMIMVGHADYEMLTRYSNLRPDEFIGLLD
ncbi:MAG: site-specific integrase [Pseudomonadota bacterium]